MKSTCSAVLGGAYNMEGPWGKASPQGGANTTLPWGPSSMVLIIALVLAIFAPQAEAVISMGNPDAKRLYDDLLSDYNKLVRPVQNTTDPLTVRIKLKLSQLIDVVRI